MPVPSPARTTRHTPPTHKFFFPPALYPNLHHAEIFHFRTNFFHFCLFLCNLHYIYYLQKFFRLKFRSKTMEFAQCLPPPHALPSSAQYFSPLEKSLPPKCNRQTQKLITHKQIILFSGNSFAILSIPYSKFKIMHRPTSPRQHKKTQKDLKTKGKTFSIKSKSHLPLPTEANNPLVEHSILPTNLNRQAIQEPTFPAHLDLQG